MVKRIIIRVVRPIKYFINDSRFTGVLLITCTLVSLMLSNFYSGDWYLGFWNYHIHYPESIVLPHSPLKWINDFIMAFFFFFAGLEIKKELVEGELSSFKRAVLPFGAAVGGMLIPALIYSAFNINTSFSHGWGIPTATDIAFSLGIASLFGKRIPGSLKIFLMALAIIDDLGAIIVITIFYGGDIQWIYLLLASGVYGLFWLGNYFRIQQGTFHVLLSFVLWYLIFISGIEASIAGVLVAFTVPVNSVPRLEKALHKVVNFIILPLFALANTAILVPPNIISSLKDSVSLGVICGLVIGKPVGIFLFSRALISLQLAKLPTNTNLKQLFGIGSLAGIGFTMSIFTTVLAFDEALYKNIATISILFSLILSLVFSWIYFIAIDNKITKPLLRKSERTYVRQDFAIG